MVSVTFLLMLVLVGWGLGWLVARSVILGPVRLALMGVADLLDPTIPHLRQVQALEAAGDELGAARLDLVRPRVPLARRVLVLPFALVSGLAHCSACAGFWIGIVLARNAWGLGPTWRDALATGVVIMGVNALADTWLSAQINRAQS